MRHYQYLCHCWSHKLLIWRSQGCRVIHYDETKTEVLPSKVVLYLSGPAKTLTLLIRMTRNIRNNERYGSHEAPCADVNVTWWLNVAFPGVLCMCTGPLLRTVSCWCWGVKFTTQVRIILSCCVTCGVRKPSLLSRWSSSAGLMLLLHSALLLCYLSSDHVRLLNNLRLTLHYVYLINFLYWLSPSPPFLKCVFFRTININCWIVEPRLSFSGANLCTLLVLLLISSGEGLLKFIQFLEETTPVYFTVYK